MSMPTNGKKRQRRAALMRHLSLPLLVVGLLVAVLTPRVQAQSTPDEPLAADPFLRGQAAAERVAAELPAMAQATGVSGPTLAELFLDDPTLALSPDNELAYFDPLAPDSAAAEAAAAETDIPANAPPVTGPEFQLATDPGAAKTIYLDFDGHTTTGTSWNSSLGIATIVSPPYDTNGSPDTWSAAELDVIRRTWNVVAEDYAPWRVNVTTIDPGPAALSNSGGGDTTWGVRVVITKDTFYNCGCGGAAFVGAFDDPTDEPAFVFNTDRVGVPEASSHEVGHTLLLTHDGTTTGDAYYLGHAGGGVPGWAPIMGASYYQGVSQWSRQEYRNANNNDAAANLGNGPDDVAIISSLTNGNGFGLRPDDHGDTAPSATTLAPGPVSAAGLISTRADVDTFTFTTGGGAVSLTANPAPDGADLDLALTLRAANGTVVATQNPPNALPAGISTTVGAGTYTLTVEGVGAGNPAADPPTGYTDYASFGRYTLTGTIPAGGAAPTIRATVRTTAGAPVAGVAVGLFRASGFDRVAWIRDATSATDGTLSFGGLAADCYILTFVAPGGQLFTNGSQYLNSAPTCVGVGSDVTVAPAVLVSAAATGSVSGTVSENGAATSQTIAIGVFQANGDGSRGAWQRDIATTAGNFTVNLTPGCYVLTFVAPAGRSFTNGTPYLNTNALCVTAGGAITGINATLLVAGQVATISGAVRTTTGAAVGGVSLGVFQATGDGSRGAWLRDTTTGTDGTYQFSPLAPGCYVITFVAPAGRTFTNGSQYLNTATLCPTAGQTLSGVNATLN